MGGVAGIYNRSQYLPEKLNALTVWSDRLELLKADIKNLSFISAKQKNNM